MKLLLGLSLLFISWQPAFAQDATPPSDLEKLQKQLARNEKALQDWPNLGRYRDDNTKLPAPAAKEKRVVFMGDSITDAWGRSYGTYFPGEPYLIPAN